MRARRLLLVLAMLSCRTPAPAPAPAAVHTSEDSSLDGPPEKPVEDAPVNDAKPAEAPRDAGTGAAPRRPTVREACEQHFPNPDCYRLFPQKVTCPARQEEVPVGEYCGLEGTTERADCRYPAARCRCISHGYCGGVTPTLLQQSGMRWECGPLPKPDDCPDQAPAAGSACKYEKKVCGWGACGSSTECTCTGGHWNCGTRYWAPPP